MQTLRANDMRDEAHIRLTLTRGPKVTSGMSPEFNRQGACLIVLAEWKAPVYDAGGIRLITSSVRRNSPQTLDSKIHHNNLLNNILAKIEANVAGVDDAVMLDPPWVRLRDQRHQPLPGEGRGAGGQPHADSCLPGITRRVVLELAEAADLHREERNLSLTELYTADEVFTTGTMGELSPVLEIDGRQIGNGAVGPKTRELQELYARRAREQGETIPF